ncbi:hypothetical protein FAES_0757 [Fibrella aestuarina BUZ 2]|uniref:Repressor LexA n=1 Tax=Fibrella aestuarina BUZ 2 TaxID=1166018 RepID=I0K3R5_9BACT|nr:hypothetical protein FAES_0757 [Fibrella aestuarina BUZ 2]
MHKEALVVLIPANANHLPIYVQPDERASIIGEVIRVFFKPSRNTAL